MDEEPGQPADEAAAPKALTARRPGRGRCRGRPEVPVLEGLRRPRPPCPLAPDPARRSARSAWRPRPGPAGARGSSRRRPRRSPVPGTVRSGSTTMRPARSWFAPVCLASCSAIGGASTPAVHSTVRASNRGSHRHAPSPRGRGVDLGDDRASGAAPHRHPGQRVRARAEAGRTRPRHRVAVEEQHPGLGRVDLLELGPAA